MGREERDAGEVCDKGDKGDDPQDLQDGLARFATGLLVRHPVVEGSDGGDRGNDVGLVGGFDLRDVGGRAGRLVLSALLGGLVLGVLLLAELHMTVCQSWCE